MHYNLLWDGRNDNKVREAFRLGSCQRVTLLSLVMLNFPELLNNMSSDWRQVYSVIARTTLQRRQDEGVWSLLMRRVGVIALMRRSHHRLETNPYRICDALKSHLLRTVYQVQATPRNTTTIDYCFGLVQGDHLKII